MGIVKRVLVRIGTRRALRQIEDLPGLNDVQRDAVGRCRDEYFDDVTDEFERRIRQDPAGRAALDAAARADGEHPFLDWLFKEGGWKLIYSIAQVIALAFGIILPPLPVAEAVPGATPPAPQA